MNYGIQMFSVRDVASVDLHAALKAVAELGYTEVEFAGFFGHTAEEVRSWLDELGLTVVATHTRLDFLTPECIDETIEYHKVIGCDKIVVPNAKWAEEELLESNIAAINRAGKYLSERGIKLAFHNHSVELHTFPYGKMPMQEIITRTEVELEPDIFWLFNAGVDPVTFLEEYKDRITMIHLKDGIVPTGIERNWSNSSEGVISRSVGSGNAPIKAVYDWALANGKRMIVESGGADPTGPEESGRCIEYLRSIENK